MFRLRDFSVLSSAAAALAACQPAREAGRPPAARPAVVLEAAEGWRGIAMPQHAGITEDMPGLFRQAAGSARTAAADRELLDPDLRLARPDPAPGPYRCRIVRLGPTAPAPRGRRAAARSSFCFVNAADDRLSLTVETSARPLGGYLWETNQRDRLVFLGAEFAPRARSAPPYAEPGTVSTAGLFERIGEFRYRLVVRGPTPGTVDVYELVAAPHP
ncbi:MAG TPA: DUF4893 domain-containing protein [Allosphingosinicella sp.]|nr:DUF4893 domain-containing protein [Allosphingosinicella sp.]